MSKYEYAEITVTNHYDETGEITARDWHWEGGDICAISDELLAHTIPGVFVGPEDGLLRFGPWLLEPIDREAEIPATVFRRVGDA